MQGVPETIQIEGETGVVIDDLEVYEYTTREIIVTANNRSIYGIAYIPDKEGTIPLVICSHGLGGSYRSCAAYAEQFAMHGIAAYCFDFCGGGGTRSDGSSTEMSVMTEVSDLEGVLTVAKEWEFVDQEKIALLGTSQGGIVSAITAARHESELASLILCYPAFLVHDAVHQRFSSLDEVPDSYQFEWITAGRPYAEDIWDYDVYAEIGNFTRKVLLMHGSADNIVPASYAERAAQTYPNVEYLVIDGAGHDFSGHAFEEAMEHIFTYLQETGLLQAEAVKTIKLSVTVGDTVGTVTMENNATAEAFMKILPLSITLHDLHGREYWFSHQLPYEPKDVIHDYMPGQLTYWCGGWVTAYYDRDDDSVIEDGSVVIGQMDEKLVKTFGELNGAPVDAKFELLE